MKAGAARVALWRPRNKDHHAGRVPRAGPAALIGLVAVTSVLDAAQGRFRVDRTEAISRTLTFSGGDGRAVEVSTVSGSIRVVGHERDVVEAVVRKRVLAESEADAATADREVELAVFERPNEVQFAGDPRARPRCGADVRGNDGVRPPYRVTFEFDLRVPRETALRLCTINGGDIQVDGVAGDFDVRHVNGAIALTRMGGSGRAVTVNGPVSVSFERNPASPSLFRSTNGDIDVALRQKLSATLLMKTFNGGLYTDFAVMAIPAPASAPERRNGRFVYRANRFTAFRVGSGGPELTFDAFNGDVRVVGSR